MDCHIPHHFTNSVETANSSFHFEHLARARANLISTELLTGCSAMSNATRPRQTTRRHGNEIGVCENFWRILFIYFYFMNELSCTALILIRFPQKSGYSVAQRQHQRSILLDSYFKRPLLLSTRSAQLNWVKESFLNEYGYSLAKEEIRER